MHPAQIHGCASVTLVSRRISHYGVVRPIYSPACAPESGGRYRRHQVHHATLAQNLYFGTLDVACQPHCLNTCTNSVSCMTQNSELAAVCCRHSAKAWMKRVLDDEAGIIGAKCSMSHLVLAAAGTCRSQPVTSATLRHVTIECCTFAEGKHRGKILG